MIARIWHGYTTYEDADLYENLLKQEIFPGIENKNLQGYAGIQLLRRSLADEVEFTTMMWFDKMENVKQFAGENYETAYVPEEAHKYLSRFDRTSIHCEIVHELHYGL